MKKFMLPGAQVVVSLDDGHHAWVYKGLWHGDGPDHVQAIFREEDGIETYIPLEDVSEVTGLTQMCL